MHQQLLYNQLPQQQEMMQKFYNHRLRHRHLRLLLRLHHRQQQDIQPLVEQQQQLFSHPTTKA
jgi:hypothetical protein